MTFVLDNIMDDRFDGFASARITERLDGILQSWVGTRWMAGQKCKGVAADCKLFVACVLDELFGWDRVGMLPSASALWAQHDAPRGNRATACMLRLYSPHRRIRTGSDKCTRVEPGDVVVTGPHGGGPGHAMIVGVRPVEVWHCRRPGGVKNSSLAALQREESVIAIYRMTERFRWIR